MELAFSSPSLLVCQGNPVLPGVRQRLQYVIRSRPEWWVYSILWQPSIDGEGPEGGLVLSWRDGYFRGPEHSSHKPSSNKITDSNSMSLDEFEWFYMLSAAGLRASHDDLLVRIFNLSSFTWLAGDHQLRSCNCVRAKEAQSHGVKTYVCISTLGGILELGSSEVIDQDLGLIKLCKSLFGTSETTTNTAAGTGGLSFHDDDDHLQKQQEDETGDDKVEVMMPDQRASLPQKLKQNFPQVTTNRRSGWRRTRNSSAMISGQEMKHNPKEAERERRAKLNRRFCALRGVVPHVSRMDKASILADAVTYIKELKGRVDELESQIKSREKRLHCKMVVNMGAELMMQKEGISDQQQSLVSSSSLMHYGNLCGIHADVKIVGSEAILTVMCPDVNYPSAKLMDELRQLELQVCFGSISCVKGVMVQNLVTRVPNGFSSADEHALKTALERRLQINSVY